MPALVPTQATDVVNTDGIAESGESLTNVAQIGSGWRQTVKKICEMSSHFGTIPACDKQTDGQTDTLHMYYARYTLLAKMRVLQCFTIETLHIKTFC